MLTGVQKIPLIKLYVFTIHSLLRATAILKLIDIVLFDDIIGDLGIFLVSLFVIKL